MQQDRIYGIHAILHILSAKPENILEIFLVESRADKRIDELLALAKQQHIPIHPLQKKQLDEWFPGTNHQGVAARIKSPALLNENDLEILIKETEAKPLFLILDGIQDPHNLGACLRTADACQVTAVIIPKDRSATLTASVRKVASGAAESVPIIQVTNLVRTLEYLKKLGVWIMGTNGKAETSLYQVDLKGPVAIALGAEGAGLRRLTEEHCDILMHIPMLGVVESLNVSVAAGVCLYEAIRQRG